MPDEYADPAALEKQMRILMTDGQQLRQVLVYAAIGRELLNALGGCKMLTLSRRRGWFAARADARPEVYVEELANALAAINGNEPTRKCLGPCGLHKTLAQFSRDKNGPGGKCRRCKTCEVARVGGYPKRPRRG